MRRNAALEYGQLRRCRTTTQRRMGNFSRYQQQYLLSLPHYVLSLPHNVLSLPHDGRKGLRKKAAAVT
jgi:hypothetical protein